MKKGEIFIILSLVFLVLTFLFIFIIPEFGFSSLISLILYLAGLILSIISLEKSKEKVRKWVVFAFYLALGIIFSLYQISMHILAG
jgi:hypothetical protein